MLGALSSGSASEGRSRGDSPDYKNGGAYVIW